MRKLICLGALTLAASANGAASVLPNAAGAALIEDGFAADNRGLYKQALEKFKAAALADPQASLPVAVIAQFYARLGERQPADALQLRQQARAQAERALKIEPDDRLAHEVLRALDELTPTALHKANAAAANLVEQADQYFDQGKFADAAKKYEAAAQADPLLSTAWTNAGDCYLNLRNYPEAEQRLRKGAAIEATNSYAWRALADLLLAQRRAQEALDAMLSAVAAQPGDGANWDKLAEAGAPNGIVLKSLRLIPKASASPDPVSGKFKIHYSVDAGIEDMGFWGVIAGFEGLRLQNKGEPARINWLSPFKRALAMWDGALRGSEQRALATQRDKPADQTWLTLRTLQNANQLEPGLLLLAFKESYRPELEAWTKANPEGVKRFIQTYGLRP
ncbi:MAG: tetratricopeptide repeat protein [Massilia sp.]